MICSQCSDQLEKAVKDLTKSSDTVLHLLSQVGMSILTPAHKVYSYSYYPSLHAVVGAVVSIEFVGAVHSKPL